MTTPTEFRAVLRQWGSGVCIVTAGSGDAATGMTVSSFSSVSADPPLVLFCANRNTQTFAAVNETESFTIHILRADQQELSQVFATAPHGERLSKVAWSPGVNGAPQLKDCLGTLVCTLHSRITAGTHELFVGAVVETQVGEGLPLLYWNGGYRGVS